MAFATGGTPQVVRHQETGLLVPEPDHEQPAHAILRLVADNTLWHQFSQASRLHVLENFNLAKQNKLCAEIDQQLLIDSVNS